MATAIIEPPTRGMIVAPFSVKAEAVDPDARTFEGMAAVWDLDLGDDVIHRGAFKDSLQEWEEGHKAMPLLNSHDHFNIFSAVGQMLEGHEAKEGLDTKWEVLEDEDGDKVLRRLRPSKRTGRAIIGSMSIGYEALKYDFEDDNRARFGRIRHLRKVKLLEVSLVLFPMAPGALVNLSTVKSYLPTATQDQLASLERLTLELDGLLKAHRTAGAGATQPPATSETAAADDGLVDAPDTTPLDALRVRRLLRR